MVDTLGSRGFSLSESWGRNQLSDSEKPLEPRVSGRLTAGQNPGNDQGFVQGAKTLIGRLSNTDSCQPSSAPFEQPTAARDRVLLCTALRPQRAATAGANKAFEFGHKTLRSSTEIGSFTEIIYANHLARCLDNDK